MNTTITLLTAAAILLGLCGAANADTPEHLRDLVDARAAGAETAMIERGYEVIRSEAEGDARYMYWRQRQTGECVVVRVANGRYESLAPGLASSCSGKEATPAAHATSGDGFESVCGVIVDGHTHRYRCTVSGARPGKGDHSTTLHYPDQTIKLDWRRGDSVQVTFEGMNPVPARFRTSEGETNFEVEGKTYFYVSDRDKATSEVRAFRD